MIFITLFPLLWFHRHKYIACLKAGKEKQRANKTMASLFGSLVWLDCQAKERQIWGFKARQCFCRKNFKYVQVLQISTKVCFDLFLCVPLSKLRLLCDPIVCCIIIVFSFIIIIDYYTWIYIPPTGHVLLFEQYFRLLFNCEGAVTANFKNSGKKPYPNNISSAMLLFFSVSVCPSFFWRAKTHDVLKLILFSSDDYQLIN